MLLPDQHFGLHVVETDGAGEPSREVAGVGSRLVAADPFADFRRPFSLSSFAALLRLSMLPLPNLLHGCPGLVRCLFNWNIRHMSDWKFFLCSELTALSSREVQDGAKSGQWKKAANRERAPGRAVVETLK